MKNGSVFSSLYLMNSFQKILIYLISCSKNTPRVKKDRSLLWFMTIHDAKLVWRVLFEICPQGHFGSSWKVEKLLFRFRPSYVWAVLADIPADMASLAVQRCDASFFQFFIEQPRACPFSLQLQFWRVAPLFSKWDEERTAQQQLMRGRAFNLDSTLKKNGLSL